MNGCASSHSSVPLRRSSASERMVAAGIRTANSQGRRSKRGRRVAMLEAYRERNSMKIPRARKATIRM